MNKELLDKVVSLYTEIGNMDENIKMLEANKADLLTQLNEYEIVTNNAVAGVDLSWAKWVATDENGEIFAYEALPIKGRIWWNSQSLTMFKRITPEQAIALCNVIPQWDDEEPIQVVNR